MPAHIVLNGLAFGPQGSGVQTYVRELVRHLPGEVDAEITVAVQRSAANLLPAGVRPLLRPTCSGARRALEGLRSLGEADLIHGLDVDLPVRCRSLSVSTVHDLSVFDVPWAFSRYRAAGERRLVASAIRRADALIAVSAFTAERIEARFGRQASVIHEAPAPSMTPPGPEEVERVRRRYRLPWPAVLHLGTLEPRKNLDTLAEACQRAGLPLVLAGSLGSYPPPARARVLGWVPGSDLPALFGSVSVVAYPSRYEGFGLPPLEAMACGAPVVASRIPPLCEILGSGAELVDCSRVEDLAAVLGDLARDPERRTELARAGLAQARTFSWEATARATAEVYRQMGLDLLSPSSAEPKSTARVAALGPMDGSNRTL